MPDHDSAARLYQNSRREARLVLIVWALALTWTVGFSYLHGYEHTPDDWVVRAGLAAPRTAADFQHVAGVPDWVFLGIVVPWLICTAFTVGFGLGMKDDDLGAEAEEGTGHGH